MKSIFLKEINSFFSSLIGYIVVSVFLIGTGLFVWIFPQSNVLDGGFSNLDTLFSLAPYIFMFLIPAITMRSFAEEKKSGTMELLLTRPLTDLQIILGKYFSALSLSLFAILPTLLYYYTIYNLGEGNIDSAAVFGSYIGLFFLAAVFTAIGILSSSLTDNQIIAFILSMFLCFVFYDGFASLAAIDIWSSTSYIISQLGIDYHYSDISKGVIDSKNIIYFLSIIISMLLLTKVILGSRKW